MPDYLADPSLTLYVTLTLMVLLLAIVAFKRRKRNDLITLGFGIALLVGLYFIDKFNESPREQTVRKIIEMGRATENHKYDDLFKHVSDKFKYNSLDKTKLREKANQFESFVRDGIKAWDYNKSSFKKIDENTVQQGFLVEASGSPLSLRYCVAEFKKESDGEWRMTSFKLYNPVQRDNAMEESIPGL